jgi:glucose-6-phosphate 1-dehydrogenase
MTEELHMSYRNRNRHADDLGPVVFVLFGATGDLARRMVLPAFYRPALEELLPRQWLLVGNGRGDVGHEGFRAHVHEALAEFRPAITAGCAGTPGPGDPETTEDI